MEREWIVWVGVDEVLFEFNLLWVKDATGVPGTIGIVEIAYGVVHHLRKSACSRISYVRALCRRWGWRRGLAGHITVVIRHGDQLGGVLKLEFLPKVRDGGTSFHAGKIQSDGTASVSKR